MTECLELSEFLDTPAFFHPEAEKDKMEGQVIRYSGEKYLSGIPTLDDIVAENDEGLTVILDDALSSCQKIPFMAIDSEGSTEMIKGMYRYVLRLYGHLINGQNALVTLIGIQVFFDILVPDRETPDECEEKMIYTHSTERWLEKMQSNSLDALLRDRTLVLTWDIETQSQELGEFAEVLNLKQNVFMICMTLHWKDDPKPLKQICLVDVET
ncbi:hypothetical protein C1646_776886 [Rhizophagus diaphanus]|nr:hypothetical protein C1646_776886 [Rhizophagus diaphanus] [Rhizophagus sp. MUCL 43196]